MIFNVLIHPYFSVTSRIVTSLVTSASTGKLEQAQSNNLLSNITIYRSRAVHYRSDLCGGKITVLTIIKNLGRFMSNSRYKDFLR